MRWFLISLGFLIISWIFFVASFGFASQAQAETWACSYKFESMENAKTQIFIREGETFRSIVPAGDTYTYKIVGERDFSIHLYKPTDDGGMVVAALYKKSKKWDHRLLSPLAPGGLEAASGNYIIY